MSRGKWKWFDFGGDGGYFSLINFRRDMSEIYLDHSATTPVMAEVIRAMEGYWRENFGNPSSIHECGRENRDALEVAREKVAQLMGVDRKMVYFTSGGSEADNLYIKGMAYKRLMAGQRGHIITSTIEHKAVLESVKFLEGLGFEANYLPVDKYGVFDLDALKREIRGDTFLVSLMLANNEVGTIEPLAEVVEICREKGIFVHTDAVQAVGKIPVDFKGLGLNGLSASAHKFYGPKGSGFLIMDRESKRKMTPMIHGGAHEMGMRAGTENVAGIIGLARALEISMEMMEEEARRENILAERLWKGLSGRIGGIHLNGHPEKRLPGFLNMSFEKVEGEGILLSLDMAGIRASSGSACTSESLEASHVLKAMGVDIVLAHGSVRFTLGRDNTEKDIDFVIETLPPIIKRLREMSVL